MLGQALVGAVIAERGFPADLVGLHAAAAAGLWAVQVVLVVAVGFEARTAQKKLPKRRNLYRWAGVSKIL